MYKVCYIVNGLSFLICLLNGPLDSRIFPKCQSSFYLDKLWKKIIVVFVILFLKCLWNEIFDFDFLAILIVFEALNKENIFVCGYSN